jgi:ABC-type phosphate transport system substrate-binding protein
MSRLFTNQRVRRWKLATLALAGLGAAFAATVAPAQANFTTGKCQGANIIGRGASFANAAHVAWETSFQNVYCADVGLFPDITYEAQGSGAGRRVMGERTAPNGDGSLSRNQPPRFGMSDEPPTPTAISQMNQGTDAAGDEGTIHVIPGAIGSVVLAVNWPDNCDRALLPDSAETNPAAANAAPFTDRVRFTRSQAEEIWNGDSAHDQWSEIFPTLASDTDCTGFITRVVRFDDSGTSFAFKQWLDKVNPTRNWDPGFTSGPDTRNWPNATLVPRTDCNPTTPPTGPQGAHLTSGCSNGNGSLMAKLNATDGSVGYSDIATARSNGLGITPTNDPGARDDDRFWTQTTNPNGVFVEPTTAANGYQTAGTKGANCEQVTINNAPATTTGDWSLADGTDSTAGWVICTLTYGLLWDDYKGPYSLQGAGDVAEEQKARSVKDYWLSIVSDEGQEVLFANDYGQMPANILNIARNGVNAVCWDKPGTGACPVVRYGYPRPRSATSVKVALVPAYNECPELSANRQHGPPLGFPSCNPPAQSSGALTIGSPDANGAGANSVGAAKWVLVPGDLGTPADESDVALTLTLTDVRCKPGTSASVCGTPNAADGADYSGELEMTSLVRITDARNGSAEAQPGTVTDTPISATLPCTASGSTGTGSACTLNTTVDALIPGAVLENKRAVWQLGQVTVNDGGSDGDVQTTPNTEFAKQGIFLP